MRSNGQITGAFSSEVGAGPREDNPSKQGPGAIERFNPIGNRSEPKSPHRGLRALGFAAAAILFIVSLAAFLDEAGRQKRSKVEPLTPAQVVSLRGAKTSGYATIRFEIATSENRRVCIEEIWLGKYYRQTKIGDILEIFPNERVCSNPLFPPVPMLFLVFIACVFLFVIMIVQMGKYIEAIRASRLQARVLSVPADEAGQA